VLTVCCVLVAGPVRGFDVDYVVRLERMVWRHLERPFQFTCLTDGTRGGLPRHIETVRIPSAADDVPLNGRGYWRKLEVFNPSHGFTGRMLFLDLDTIIVGDLAAIVDWPADLALTTDALVEERAHVNTDRYGRGLVRRFNSSVMVWNAGTQDQLYTDLTSADIQRLSTDQDWIGEQAPHAEGMPLEWFPRISQVRPPWPASAKVVLCKKPKNHDAITQWPELGQWWN
jgi:hypothetical protein